MTTKITGPRRRPQEEVIVTGEDRVVVSDIDIPFGSMVAFMVKWAVASVPAAIILFLIGFFIMTIGFPILGGLMR